MEIPPILMEYEPSDEEQRLFSNELDKFGPGEFYRFIASLLRDVPQENMLTRLWIEMATLKLLTFNAGRGTVLSDREFIEPIIARDQCYRLFRTAPTTISGFPIERNNSSVCWLCGFTVGQMGHVLGERSWTDARQKATFLNAPECEHILPAGCAMLYLDVPAPNAPIDPSLIVNYEWSHRLCNGDKDSILFVQMFDAGGNVINPVPSPERIRRYVTALAATPTMQNLLRVAQIPLQTWIDNRCGFIAGRVAVVTNQISTLRNTLQNPLGRGLFHSEFLSIIRNINTVYRQTKQIIRGYGDNRIPPGKDTIVNAITNFKDGVSNFFNNEAPTIPEIAALGIIPRDIPDNELGRLQQYLRNIQSSGRNEPIFFDRLNQLFVAFGQSIQTLTGNQLLALMDQQRDLYLQQPPHAEYYTQLLSGVAATDPLNRFCGPNGVLTDLFDEATIARACTPRAPAGGKGKTFRRKHNGILVRIKKRGNRAGSRTYRKRRTSNRGGVGKHGK